MPLDVKALPAAQAWLPLEAKHWTADCARHLLRRMGFAAAPDEVALTLKRGITGTLQSALGAVRPFPAPAALTNFVTQRAETQAAARMATAEQRQQLLNDNERLRREAFLETAQQWLAFARRPENSAQENLVLFLSDVLVVAFSKVKAPDRLFAHLDMLRASWQLPYPDLCKAVTRSPAMIEYLDLNTSYVGVPNENYARELMELFTLGEGSYTEADVKEAARALTGMVIRGEQGFFARQRWDNGSKTIFHQTGRWDANGVVDLIFRQPAARTFLPRQFLAWYVTDDALPAPYVEELGLLWSQRGWKISTLAEIVLSSRLFYNEQFQGNLIKSPLRYYLGLLQDLNLDVSPFSGQLNQTLRAMGQEPFNPPNVRGWVGGRNWINSSTLAARRQLVQQLFNPAAANQMTADQRMMLASASSSGSGNIAISPEQLQHVAARTNAEIAEVFLNYYMAGTPNPAYRAKILGFLQSATGPRPQVVREAAVALLQSPLYHLC